VALEVGIMFALIAAAFGVGWLGAARRGRAQAAVIATTHAESARRLDERVGRLETDRRRMDLVLSSMLEGVVLFDGSGQTIYANSATEGHLGGVPRSVAALLPLGMRSAVERAAIERAPVSSETEVAASRWLRGSAVPVQGDGSVLLVIRDVTEARRLDAVRRDFVANASHELKTPAATIQAAAETIRSAATDDPSVVPRFAAQLEGEAIRLSRIVGDLLDLSRLESGSELEDVVALDAVLRDESERFEDPAAEAGVRLTITANGPALVRGSARDLALLVRNLVDNAIRYTPTGGSVDVTLATDDGEAVLTVTDTGAGIPTRDLPRIFERFYRVDRARSRETGGTGLGLAIVRHVAENYGGRVSVDSELGRGTRFEVRLPAAG
jgi:two-component system, OmpR family, phosphate regulon sensor histidine kinase PhoR